MKAQECQFCGGTTCYGLDGGLWVCKAMLSGNLDALRRHEAKQKEERQQQRACEPRRQDEGR